jgi:putative flippase GtrA
MQLLVSVTGLQPLLARTVSFPLAVTLTWLLNRVWTFDDGRGRIARAQYLRYGLVQITGFAINYAVFAVLVLHGGPWREQPIFALAVGAGIAMVTTFAASKRLVFSAPEAGEAPR